MILNSIAVILEDKIQGLNPKLWTSTNTLQKSIRTHLLRIANDWIAGLDEIPEVTDIVITGSSANANWTSHSDIDLHIIIDFTKAKDPLALHDYYLDNIHLFNDHHEIKVKGLLVELYAQDKDEPHYSSGIYSIQNDKWIKEPAPLGEKPDSSVVERKSAVFKKIIDDIVALATQGEFSRAFAKSERLRKRVHEYRKAGLSKRGEYSIENLVFKDLRNSGFLEKLIDADRKAYDELVSVNEALVLRCGRCNRKLTPSESGHVVGQEFICDKCFKNHLQSISLGEYNRCIDVLKHNQFGEIVTGVAWSHVGSILHQILQHYYLRSESLRIFDRQGDVKHTVLHKINGDGIGWTFFVTLSKETSNEDELEGWWMLWAVNSREDTFFHLHAGGTSSELTNAINNSIQ